MYIADLYVCVYIYTLLYPSLPHLALVSILLIGLAFPMTSILNVLYN